MARVLLPEDGWLRAGRGRGIDFFSTQEELAAVLSGCLPARYAPYEALGIELVKEGRTYVQNPITVDISDMLKLREKGIWNFFIRSMVIARDLEVVRGEMVSALLAVNGLVSVQFGTLRHAPRGEMWSRSSIGMIDKVVNQYTNQIIVHNEYRKVLEALRRGIRKVLRYPTVFTYPDGREVRYRSVLMSEAFAQKCRSGEIVPKAQPDFRGNA